MVDNKIKELLKDRPELVSKLVYNKTYEEVAEILSLEELNNPKYKHIFTSNIWKTYYKNIKLILSMKEWQDPKFSYLLTSSVWNRSYSEVKNILSMPEWNDPKYEHLLTPNIWQSSYKNVKKILGMKEWDNPEYAHLFTSSIWNNSYEQISSKLKMSCFKLPQYKHLLTPSIFLIPEQNIEDNITLFKELGLERFIDVTNIRISAYDQRLLIKYMINNDIPLVVRGKLHEILRNPTSARLEKYGISWDVLRENATKNKVKKITYKG